MQPNDYYGGFKKEPSRMFQVHCTVIANTWYQQDVCWKRICKAWSLLNGRFYSLQGRSQPTQGSAVLKNFRKVNRLQYNPYNKTAINWPMDHTGEF